MKFVNVIKDIQKKLVKIIGTKDVEKRKSMIVNLAAAISVLQTDYPLSKNQKEILNQILRILAKEYEILDEPDIDFSDIEEELDIDFGDIEAELEDENESSDVPVLDLSDLTIAEAKKMFKGLNVIIRDDRNESGIAQGKIDNVSVLKPNTPAQQFVLTIQSTLDNGSQETFKSRLNTTEIEKFVSRIHIPAFDVTTENTSWGLPISILKPIITKIPYSAQVNMTLVSNGNGNEYPKSQFFKNIEKYAFPNNTFYVLSNIKANGERIVMFISWADMEVALAAPSQISLVSLGKYSNIHDQILYASGTGILQNVENRIVKFKLSLDSKISQQTKPSKNVKGAGRKFDTSWVNKFLTEAPMEFIDGDLEKFIKGEEDDFIYQYYNDKGIRITYKGNNFYNDYFKETESKYNSKSKTRTKKFNNKKEFLAALKRIIK